MKMEKKVTRKCDLCGSWGTISRSSKGRSLSHVLLFATPWTAAHQASLSFTVSWSLLKLLPIESMMPSTIASSVTPFSSCPQSLPASGSFPTSWLFTLDDQNIGALASVLSMNIESWFPLGFTGLIFLRVHGTLKSLLQHNLKASVLWPLAFFMVQLSYLYMTTGKTVTLTIPLLAKWCHCFLICCLGLFEEGNGNPPRYSCLENSMDRGAWQATVHRVAKSQTRLSEYPHRFVIALLSRSKHLSVSCLQSLSQWFWSPRK